MRGLRLLRASAVLPACLGVLLLAGATPASAHTALKDATPAPGSTVGTGTGVVALTFVKLKPGTTPEISVTGPDGTAVPVGRPTVTDGAVTCATVSPLKAGVTTLTYTVTASDGDTQTSAFQFQVADGAGAVRAPDACRGLNLAAPGADQDADGTFPGLDRTTALVALAATVAAVGGGALVVRRRRRPRSRGRRRAVG
ncbi:MULTISPECIES: copper resistance CopC family protein [unclassified Streptomyces]|uniref:copper resistance CopC family protein n=1 Tax=unclassified Streptomyces TaxID=2593676 RepID=UPI001F03FF7D|nr:MULTISPECIES: copper resistance CopC family protein [unclassified Streptomyces]MCH0566659.1 copper resistance protein CopC [Streptomyces sp. MUM 2J]MCH0573355.1 copper resistance protein CopC [Streptomyces sp. MUM 136J]